MGESCIIVKIGNGDDIDLKSWNRSHKFENKILLAGGNHKGKGACIINAEKKEGTYSVCKAELKNKMRGI